MSHHVEDILSGEDPNRNLEKEPVGPMKKLATYILKIVKGAKVTALETKERAQLWDRIELSTQRLNRKKYLFSTVSKWGVAACSILAVMVSLWLVPLRKNTQEPIAIAALNNRNLSMDTGAIKLKGYGERTLILDDQETIDVSLLNEGDVNIKASIAFNTLTVPYGKRTEVVLPDGSKVWLNAGSQLTFPESFEADKREVYLEGEGYFDIVHAGHQPFYVHTSDLLIKVLGTTFNVSSYRDDAFTSTVLVSGKIELHSAGKKQFEKLVMEPGSTAILQKDTKKLDVHRDNVEDHISWTRRQLVLRNTPLNELLVRLERIYNTSIVAENQAMPQETFSGRLDLTQPLINLLTIIYDHGEYHVQQDERRITIRKK